MFLLKKSILTHFIILFEFQYHCRVGTGKLLTTLQEVFGVIFENEPAKSK